MVIMWYVWKIIISLSLSLWRHKKNCRSAPYNIPTSDIPTFNVKHLSIFLPRKTLDQMYKALVRSHFDYCDILYHIPSLQTQLGVCLTDLMEKAERIQYQAALAITGA